MLFCHIMGGGFSNQFLAIWHALKVDRAQRDILLAALNANLLAEMPEKMAEDIKWICTRADILEDARNDALHSPLLAQRRGPNDIMVMPDVGGGHVRAKKLLTKHLLSEFRWCRDGAIRLTDFVGEIHIYLSGYRKSWPQKPRLAKSGADQ